MDRNQIYPELEAPREAFPIPAMNVQQRTFSNTTRFFSWYTTFFGFRMFALPNERCRIAYFSLPGIAFFLPAIGIAGYLIWFMYQNARNATKFFGFFSGETSVVLEMLFTFVLLVLYLIISLLCTQKLCRLIETLDSLTISEKAWKEFTAFYIVTFLFSIVMHIVTCYEMIVAYDKMVAQTESTLNLNDYITYYAMIYCVAVTIFPLNFLALFVFFVGRAFDEHFVSMETCPKSKIEEELPWFYVRYLELTKVLEVADGFFSYVSFFVVGVALANTSIFILNIGNLSFVPPAINYTMISLMVFNFLGKNLCCIWINEKSRAIGDELHHLLPHGSDLFIWVDTFHRKITDASWGMTLGKFFLMDRTAFVGQISAMVTFLALYSQFAQSTPTGINANATSAAAIQEYILESRSLG